MNKYYELQEVFAEVVFEWSTQDPTSFSSDRWKDKQGFNFSQWSRQEFDNYMTGFLLHHNLFSELNWITENNQKRKRTSDEEKKKFLENEVSDRNEVQKFLLGNSKEDFLQHELRWLEKQALAYEKATSQKTRTHILQRADTRLNYIAEKLGIATRIPKREGLEILPAHAPRILKPEVEESSEKKRTSEPMQWVELDRESHRKVGFSEKDITVMEVITNVLKEQEGAVVFQVTGNEIKVEGSKNHSPRSFKLHDMSIGGVKSTMVQETTPQDSSKKGNDTKSH